MMVALAILFAESCQTQESVWNELNSKVGTLYQQGRYVEAEDVAKEALKVAEKTFGTNHPDVATSLNNLAALYRQIGKEDEAEILETRARKIRSKR